MHYLSTKIKISHSTSVKLIPLCYNTLDEIELEESMTCERNPIEDGILLDVLCLDKGVPPLSQNLNVAIDMICQLPSLERRKVNRKIRKLCKKAIRADLNKFTESRRRSVSTDLGFKTKRDTFSRDILLKRLSFLRRTFTRQLIK